MGTSWYEKLSTIRESVSKELVQGREFANQLQILLQKPDGDTGSPSANELVGEILRSFTETLSLVCSCESGEVCQNLASSQVDSACCDDRRSEDSGESRKRPVTKERRGCYKRKKTSQSRTTVSATMEDGYAWRKYGQKEILNAKYPRSYFRCTHKYDQGCGATKQVQRMEEDSLMFHITYIGHHTCQNILRAPQIISDSNPWESYIVISNPKIPGEQEQEQEQDRPRISTSTPMIKQEYKEETQSDVTDNVSSLDSVVWKDLMPFESADYGVLVHCTEATSLSLDMDLVVNSIDFDSDFHAFDESEFI